MARGKEQPESRRPLNRESAYFEVKDPRLYEFNALVRHSKNVLPNVEDVTLLATQENPNSGLVVGYIQDGDNRITIPLGGISPDGKAWTAFSALPIDAFGGRDDTKGNIPTKIVGSKTPKQE